jgi:large repetitive protein
MTTRRGSSHVRPRPPSSGRKQPVKVAPPDRRRVRQYRGLDARRKRAPLATRTLLALGVLALAAATFVLASGGLGAALHTLGSGIESALGRLTATPVPSATLLPPTNSPVLTPPAQPFTNVATVDLTVSVPVEVVGDPTAKVRIYLALEGLDASPVVDVPVGTTSRMTVPFDLTPGRNDISATLFRGDEESDFSPIVTWFLDQDPPKITVTAPKNGAAVDTPDVTIKGKTQANTSLVALNAANGTSISSVAAKDGTFEFGLPLAPGTNEIKITGTDPAGNVGQTTLKLLQGSKEMGVQLTASTYRISVAHHPGSLQLVVLVTDPAGMPLAGASAFFTLQIPGLAPISNELVTAGDGRAVFTTPLVGTLTTGGGLGTVLITSDLYGQSTDRVTLTFVK